MRENSKKINYIRIIFIILTAACMIIIFMFSSENSDESSSRSGSITQIIANFFISDFDSRSAAEQTRLLDIAEHIIRKLAHFSIYTALGFCSSCAVGKKRFFSNKTAFTLIFCFIYACSDELHQYFVPGRACLFTDVLIDTSGALTGILISMAIMAVIDKKNAV